MYAQKWPLSVYSVAPSSTTLQAKPVQWPVPATQRENRLNRKKEDSNYSDSNKNMVFFTSPCSRERSQEGQKSGSSITNIIWKWMKRLMWESRPYIAQNSTTLQKATEVCPWIMPWHASVRDPWHFGVDPDSDPGSIPLSNGSGSGSESNSGSDSFLH